MSGVIGREFPTLPRGGESNEGQVSQQQEYENHIALSLTLSRKPYHVSAY